MRRSLRLQPVAGDAVVSRGGGCDADHAVHAR
jgi:hypothetical protein